jgi:hypothetical protein
MEAGWLYKSRCYCQLLHDSAGFDISRIRATEAATEQTDRKRVPETIQRGAVRMARETTVRGDFLTTYVLGGEKVSGTISKGAQLEWHKKQWFLTPL